VNYDRHLYVSGGRVMWGVNDGTQRILQSGTGMNNGAWHHVVGTVGPNGQYLYVDGNLVGSSTTVVKGGRYWGYWKIGGDATWAGNQNFTGDIDEVAIYGTVLSPAVIAQHNQLGRGAAPANLPPAASFTATPSGMTGQFNASASSDSDGTIVAYEWTFGDGATGTGVTANRTYATAGTYTVGLTVRDDDGATSSTTRTVTVTSTPPPTTLAQDAFGRTVANGWGSATTGGAWSTSATANYAVDGSQGTFLHTAGTTRRALLAGVSSTRSDVVATLSFDKAPAGGATVTGIVGRQVGADFYQARIRFAVGGTARLELVRGSSTVLTFVDLPGTFAAGAQLKVRVQVVGTNPTTIQARVWAVGATEPSTWTATVTDATAAMQSAGSIGVESYLSASATNAPVTARFDDLVATPVP
jgi:PKD repeat protein